MQNQIFIGDNLAVLTSKLMQPYKNAVDTIYIDPPYNTNNSFSYSDSKKHEDWIDFMRFRLVASLPFLKNSGIVFISIDDNEYAALKLLCDDIFGSQNFLGTFITRQSQRSNAKFINITHEYILCYAKNKKQAAEFKIKRILIPEDKAIIQDIQDKIYTIFKKSGHDTAQKALNTLIAEKCLENNSSWLKNYNCIDEDGNVYFGKDLSVPSPPAPLSIPEIGLNLPALPTRGWASPDKFRELYATNRLVYKNERPYEKHLLIDAEDHASSILNFYSRQGTNDLNKLGLRDLFDTPKPVELIKYLIRISTPKDGMVLDFFAGSGTTAQAIYELNCEEMAARNYILIQLPEKITINSKSYDKAIELKLEPRISELMLYRINKYLSLNKQPSDYTVQLL